MAQFGPESVAHFAPEWVAYFGSEWVAQFGPEYAVNGHVHVFPFQLLSLVVDKYD
jgi:hypothetical protein